MSAGAHPASTRATHTSKEATRVMTWRSAINEMPDLQYIETFEPDSTEYEEWLEKVTAEPWFLALEAMVKWTRAWVGTEEQLFEELEMRAGREVFASPDFPSDFERLTLYAQIARDGFAMKHIEFWHYSELTEEDLDHYDAPGWGPEAPILVFRDRAADRPNYYEAMCRLLARGDALPLAVLIFTGEDACFRKLRRWTGTSVELTKKLQKHSPNSIGGVPMFFANCFRPREEHKSLPRYRLDPPDLLEPGNREGFQIFYERMTGWASALRELGIKVSWERRPYLRTPPEGGSPERGSRLYWTIERPRWKKREDLFVDSGLTAKDLTVMVMAWMADVD